ncbi:MAG: primosome assembly protein PriA [Propionibacteriaceae bacterium]|jgi:primosomal protein N' (replication factor Y)|nr:primosome assembly protein PriA [Propionibacteriaceae bacterium]
MIAQVWVDTGLPFLDYPFDYLVAPELEDRIRPGMRVKVGFNSRQLPGIVAGLADTSEVANLVTLSKLISEEVVVPEASASLFRAVADHCAGTFMDVARLAIPPRSARAEARPAAVAGSPRGVHNDGDFGPANLDQYPLGSGLRQALRAGRSPRATWTLTPTPTSLGDWASGLTSLVADTLTSGRSALVLVPDATDCARMTNALTKEIDRRLVVTLSANLGQQARYSAFLASLRGEARVVVGTRAAVYAPLTALGLIAVWEESDPSFAEPHCPYPTLRDVVAIRATQTGAGVVFASYSRSPEIQNWVDKGWLREIVDRRSRGDGVALVRVAASDDYQRQRDPTADYSRLPQEAFQVIREALGLGPVLVAVPWLGHRRNFYCTNCGDVVRCACGGGFEERASSVVVCGVCARSATDWRCACGSRRWRAATIGSARTADELLAAFKTTTVLRSDSSAKVDQLGDEPLIVIATPGCEPVVAAGYAAAIILDAQAVLSRGDIRAGEEAVRRWMSVISLVKPSRDHGVVLIVGPSEDRAIQAVLRLDAPGFAARELADRREAEFPPATRMAIFAGEQPVLAEIAQELTDLGYVDLIGPVQEVDSPAYRLIARVPAAKGEAFAAELQQAAGRRSRAIKAGKLTWRLDPDWLGG